MGTEQGTGSGVPACQLCPGIDGSVLGRAPGSCSPPRAVVLHLPGALQNSCSVPRDACGSFTPLRLFSLKRQCQSEVVMSKCVCI